MNDYAEELNRILEPTIAFDLLSEKGKRFFFPKKIVYQCTEATEHAHKFNASIGIALEGKIPFETPSVKNRISSIPPEETVSYAPVTGDKNLTKLWHHQLLAKNPSLQEGSFSDSLVVSGITHAVSVIADLFIDKGDFIFIPDLYWDNYKLVFETGREAEIINYPLFDDSMKFNIDGLIVAVNRNCSGNKIIILFNFPNNPTGFTPSIEEALHLRDRITELAEEGKKVLVITDDAYFGMFYEDSVFQESLFSLFSSAHRNILAVKADGATKEHYYWGMRIGFLTFGSSGLDKNSFSALAEKAKGIIRASVSSSCRLSQSILIKAMSDPGYEKQLSSFFNILRERYLKVREIILSKKSSQLFPLPFNSGYFITLRTSFDAELLRKKLLNDFGIGTVSLQNRYLRVAYSGVEKENLDELFNLIYSVSEKL